MKKFTLYSELVYFFALILMALAVSMTVAADFGVSMIVAPAYMLSQKLGISFGQAEYVVQGALFIICCLVMRRFKPIYFFAFVTGLIYGAVLDLWGVLIPQFTMPGTATLSVRIVLFVLGMVLTALAVALFFKVYIYPQVYDFFVKAISDRYHINQSKFKIGYDTVSFVLSCVLSWILFGELIGIGIGTVILTLLNGIVIGFFSKLIDRYCNIVPKYERFSRLFDF